MINRTSLRAADVTSPSGFSSLFAIFMKLIIWANEYTELNLKNLKVVENSEKIFNWPDRDDF